MFTCRFGQDNAVKILTALRAGTMRDHGSILAALRSGHAVARLVAILRYKLQVDSLEFLIYYGLGVVSVSNRNEYLGYLMSG